MLTLLLAAELWTGGTAAVDGRGERRFEAVARMGEDSLAVAELSGPRAPPRTELALELRLEPFQAAFRVVPGMEGLTRAGAELGVHAGPLTVSLLGRTARAAVLAFDAAGARLEVEAEEDDVRAGASASAWALSLVAPGARRPWLTLGETTLDWAAQWEAALYVARDFDGLTVQPSFSLAQPAAGGSEARAALRAELRVGDLKVSAQLGGGRLFAEQALWMIDFELGVTVRAFAGD